MLITTSLWRKVVATIGAVVGFVFVYDTTIRESRERPEGAVLPAAVAALQPGTELEFSATAYCKGETTASGVGVRTGVAAADPDLLPVGTVLRVSTRNEKYDGVWTVMDTGPAVQGRALDLYMWSCHEALAFGRRPIQVTVLRLGWHPSNSAPSLIDRLFRRRERRQQEQQQDATPSTDPVLPLSPSA